MRSIIHDKTDRTCYICMMLHGDYRQRNNLEEHHVFGGNPNRGLSEKFGLKIYLCAEHHRTSKEAVHKNKQIRIKIQSEAQKAFIRTYPEKDFKEIFGKNYIEPDTAAVSKPKEPGFILLEE